MADLNGLHVVITRPEAKAERWAQQLKALGASVTLLPLMDIVPVRGDEHSQAIKNRIVDFDHYNKAIFVSQNAVEYGFEWLENYWPQLPIGIHYFAVGETTAKLLQSYGVAVTDLAQTQDGAMTSEVLLQSPELQQVAGEKILIFRGLGGRTHLGDTLRSRGALVDYCELYERRLPLEALSRCRDLFGTDTAAALAATLVTLHSGEAFLNLLSLLNQLNYSEKIKQHVQLLVPSVRIAEHAASEGFTTIHTADNATDSSMLQRLMRIHSN